MRVLVTGGSGFLGGHVIPLLLDRGHDVSALARSDTAARRLEALGAVHVAGDLDDPTSLDAAFAASANDALVNLASLGFGHAPAIVSAAEDAGIRRAIFVSTTAIFTRLEARSRATRLAAEEVITASVLEWTILRPTMIYGTAGDRNMARLVHLLQRTPVVPLPGGGRGLQQPVHVDDVAAAVLASLERPASVGRAYDLAGPEPLTLRQVVEATASATARQPTLVAVPLRPLVVATRVAQAVAPVLGVRAEQLERLAEDKSFDIGPARRDLGYAPRPFAEGIAEEAALLGPRAAPAPALLLRTIRHLRPTQVLHRLRLRAQRSVLEVIPTGALAQHPSMESRVGWPSDFSPIDLLLTDGLAAENHARGKFTFLNQERVLGAPPDWDPQSVPRLWRWNLHYFEWAWAFVAHPDRCWGEQAFAELWDSWRRATPFARGDAWAPYVASLRAWALCGIASSVAAGTELERALTAELVRHAWFLRRHLELDVGGNHLVKNLKALAGLGVYLGDDDLIDLARRHLARQLNIQVLPDGGHFERSPSYHCQVLGDLVDVGGLLKAAGLQPVAGLDEAVDAMRGWLAAMLLPDGDVPLFNDCTLVGRGRLSRLRPGPAPEARLTVLQPSGYVVVRFSPRFHLVADVGPPCPPDLPAHAHADCLSFELCIDGRRFIVDSGTSTYEPGSERARERSTAAHNTVVVDRVDQTEVWGTFRAGRRARATLEQAIDDGVVVEVQASHDGYRWLPGRPCHRRTWRITGNLVEVLDEVLGTGRHRVQSIVHLAPDQDAVVTGDRQVTAGPLRMTWVGSTGASVDVGNSVTAVGFGEQRTGSVVTASVEAELPLTLQARFEAADTPTAEFVPPEPVAAKAAR